MKTYTATAPSGVQVTSEVPLDYVDSWFRVWYLSFFVHSYLTWGKKIRLAFQPKPEDAKPQDEQEAGKVGTL